MRRTRIVFYVCVFAALVLGAFLPTDWYWRWPYAALIVLIVISAEQRFRRR